ncbi:porin [Pelomonas sp. KK5]|uniref:porin n=1 Tax=Pelomonas sp. KK5 TaxID=1855730 RepID=UPI00097BDFD2|nr:porin [Pelomonas sp. KK5]
MKSTTAAFGLAALALACAAHSAHAQNVTIFGVIDQAAEYTSGVNAGNGTSTHQYRLGLGAVPSRLGFRGSEDLGGGLKGIFTLEGGLNADTGTSGQGSRMWGRQAFVGLQGDWGQFTMGRLYMMRYFAMFDGDFFGAGSQGTGTIDAGIPNARADNAVSYRYNPGGTGFSGGVNYSFGRDTVAANNPAAAGCAGEATIAKQCSEYSAMLRYEGASWAVAASYDKMYGGTSTTYGGLVTPDLTDTRAVINGYIKFGAASKLGWGWLGRNNQGSATTPKSNLYWVAGEQRIGDPVVLTGMLAQIKYKDSANKATVLALRANYWFSKRTTVYVSEQYVSNKGNLAVVASTNSPGTGPLPGDSQNALQVGIGHSF